MWNLLLVQLKNLLNSKLFLYCVIGVIVYFWFNSNANLHKTVSRLESNQVALTEQYSRELQLTRRDFQRIYHKEDSIAKLIGIKPKQVQQVIVNNYNYTDTTVNVIPLDTAKSDTVKFLDNKGCIKVEGFVTKNNLVITKKESSDVLHTFLYGIEREHKFLFIKWGNWVVSKATTYSECKQDTIAVEKNIKIINN